MASSFQLGAYNVVPQLWLTSTLINRCEAPKTLGLMREPMSQPYFWKSVKMTLTFPKWGLGSPPGLSKFQSLIVGVKTPCIEMFFILLESYRSVDVENGLA